MVTNKKLVIVSLFGLLILSSCSIIDSNIPSELKETEAKVASYSPAHLASDYGKSQGYNFLPSIGSQKILVLPIMFQGSSIATDYTTELSNIDQALNESSNNELFTSVHDYYYQSSYGKLDLKFEVSENVILNENSVTYYQSLVRKDPDSATEISTQIINSALETLNVKEKYNSVMAIYFVNNKNMTDVEKELFWSYTINFTTDNDYVYDNYLWASYYDLFDVEKYVLDTHTYIHEVAHLLGIDDYYNYDNNQYNPTSVLETMVANVGDHNAYTKLQLGWINPITPESNGYINLNPFEDSGDALIIGNNWNGSTYDEYIVLTYYTPTGLNKRDVNYPTFSMYSKAGIMAYHVDSRIGKIFENGLFSVVENSSDLFADSSANYQILHSNTPSKTISNDKSKYLISLLEAGETNYAMSGYLTDNRCLFKNGSSFGVNQYKNFTFHSGKKPDYKFYVGELKDNATIYVTK